MMRPLFSLAGISLVCALLLAGAYELTEQAVEDNRAAHAWRLAFELVGERFDPSGVHWRDDALELPNGAWLRRTAVPGYAGEIRLLAAFSAGGRLLGGRVARHRETPGLGDFVDLDKSDWMLRFAHTPASEVEAVTGATITSNAVKQGMQRLVDAPDPALGGQAASQSAPMTRCCNGSGKGNHVGEGSERSRTAKAGSTAPE